MSASPDISFAAESEAGEWDAYVNSNPNSNFFQRFGWLRAINRTYGHRPKGLIAKDRTNKVVGILPLVLVKSAVFGTSLISTAFTVGGGVVADDPATAERLIDFAREIACAEGVQYLEIRGGGLAPGWRCKSDVYAGFEKAIHPDEDSNLKNIPRKKRADVRKAIKAKEAGELTFERDSNLNAFYQLYAESVRNLGTPVMPKAFIANLLEEFDDCTEVAVVSASGRPVAGLVSFYHHNRVMPYYGGALPTARRLHAYDFMYWSQMRCAAARGCTVFDFGRSKFGTGAYDYKSYWGFEPHPLEYQYYLVEARDVPDVNPNNPKFAAMTRIWRRLPLPIANRLGPLLAGNLA